MSFTIYPAIDIRNGKVVRLFQGDYNQEITYGNPVEVAIKWQEQGAKWLHLVDLDGAKDGNPSQLKLIKEIVKNVTIPVQVGGGIRNLSTIEQYLSIGITRVILGTAALENKELADVTGIEDAVFCHKARFIVIAKSKEGAIKLAEIALKEK